VTVRHTGDEEEMPDSNHEFAKAEYDSLRAEIVATIKEIWDIERYVVAGMVAVWAWLATHRHVGPRAVWFLPFALVLYGVLRASALWDSAQVIVRYLTELEPLRKPGGPDIIGYETHRKQFHADIEKSARRFWIVLLVVSFVAGLYKVSCGK